MIFYRASPSHLGNIAHYAKMLVDEGHETFIYYDIFGEFALCDCEHKELVNENTRDTLHFFANSGVSEQEIRNHLQEIVDDYRKEKE